MSRQIVLRRRILESLAYPRRIAISNVDLSSYPYSGFFKVMDNKRQQCSKNYECDWLNSTDEFNELAAKPSKFLYGALTFRTDYVDTQTALQNHNSASCKCDSCNWQRNARDPEREYVQEAE